MFASTYIYLYVCYLFYVAKCLRILCTRFILWDTFVQNCHWGLNASNGIVPSFWQWWGYTHIYALRQDLPVANELKRHWVMNILITVIGCWCIFITLYVVLPASGTSGVQGGHPNAKAILVDQGIARHLPPCPLDVTPCKTLQPEQVNLHC